MPKPTKTSARFCSRCGDRIIWAVTGDGNRALNHLPSEGGGYLAYQEATGRWVGRVTEVGPLRHLLEKPYVAHALTCVGTTETETE